MLKSSIIALALLTAQLPSATALFEAWPHSGTMTILTTQDGANLPEGTVVEGFPLLIRLHKDWFNFQQTKPLGEDIRFSTAAGAPLAYEVEEWDAAAGTASIWVRVPAIKGHAQQEIRLHWGNAAASSESSGAAVFNESNGYLSVWHMNEPVKDVAGTLESKVVGTTSTAGVIGQARHLAGKEGIFGGDKIANYPAGGSEHSTEAWFRAERPNTTIIGWGNEGGGRGSKVRMQFRSPPHVHIDSDFSDVDAPGRLPMGEWIHVAHTYANGEGCIYINGALAAAARPVLNIKSPARLWLGGWYRNYDFVGDLDECRISKVARSGDWLRLEYENQKLQQTLVGPIIQAGSEFSVSPAEATVPEGKSVTFSAKAGGARKIYWILKRDGQESVVATDRFAFTFDAGRVTGDQAARLQVKAVYADGVKTRDVAIAVQEAIPDPIFTLTAPAAWDGRAAIDVVPQVSNLAELQAKEAGKLKTDWAVSGIAVITESAPGKLVLKRAQNSGPMTVTATMSNGGQPVTRSATIATTEPKADAWAARLPAKDEQPVDNQFYARDDKNEGTLYCNGTLDQAADAVFLKVYAEGTIFQSESHKLTADKTYAFAVKLKPGLIKYKMEFGTTSGGSETVVRTVDNLVCGDAYIIEGQSNAEARAPGKEAVPYVNPWIRTYGDQGGGWGNAIRAGTQWWIGYWGMDLAIDLSTTYEMPICIINGAVGGTRIDEHLRNEANHEDARTIYGRLLTRIEGARLTHGIRGLLWHQGEADQGTQGPTGDYDWKTYHQYFVDLSAAWKQDYPNLLHYYIFQIWPNACTDPSANDMLREVQRTLPRLYSNMRIMSTLGIVPGSSCHYVPAGYRQFSVLMGPLVKQDNYGFVPVEPITAPDLKRASYTNAARNEIALEFGQEMTWTDAASSLLYLDGAAGKVAAGSVSGNVIKLQLTEPSTSGRITYLVGKAWDGKQDKLLYGKNGIAALTFCDVPIEGGR